VKLSKLVRRSALAVALVTPFAVVGLASPASANIVSSGGITCSSVTFDYGIFPAGSTTTSDEVVSIDGVQVAENSSFMFSGLGASDTVLYPALKGTHTVTASATWTNSLHGPGSGTFSSTVHCTPNTLPHLYWSNGSFNTGTIVEANLDGTHTKTIAASQKFPSGVAVNSSHLYWANAQGGTIVEANLDGTNPQTIATGQNSPGGIAVDSSHLYWSNSNANTIVAANLDGTNPQTIATNQGVPRGLAVNASHLYWANASTGSIVEANLDGTNPQTIATGGDNTWGVAVSSSHLYWSNLGGGTIVEANLDGTNPQTIARGQVNVLGVAVSGSNLYWANAGSGAGGTIVEANLDGTNPQTIASDNAPRGVAVGP
jgi:hypothetical protein